MIVEPELPTIKIDIEPKRLMVTSELYVKPTAWGYQPVVNVIERKTKREYVLYVGAKSLSNSIEQLRRENSGRTTGLEFWIRKENQSKYSPYVVEET